MTIILKYSYIEYIDLHIISLLLIGIFLIRSSRAINVSKVNAATRKNRSRTPFPVWEDTAQNSAFKTFATFVDRYSISL